MPWLRGSRAWIAGVVAGGFLAVLFVSDYFAGRALYGALATYHAYLEFPVLLALLIGARGTTPLNPPGRANNTRARGRDSSAACRQAFDTVVISEGLFGRPVPSWLLPSWPSAAIEATTSREAVSNRPKIV